MQAIGHYEKKQIHCSSRVVSWSHRARFQMALRLVGAGPENKLLDYGCGDGMFLAQAAERFGDLVGTDISVKQLQDCQRRLGHLENVRFVPLEELGQPEHQKAYDVVTCMETLEHCLDRVAVGVIRNLHSLCKPDGRVVISVPIETGFPFLLKYTIRKVLGWRNIGDYKHYESYSFKNALKMVFAGRNTIIDRPVYGPEESPFHSHYGFNWRNLREKVSPHFSIEKTYFSPLGFLRGIPSSQVWFICRPLRQTSSENSAPSRTN